MREARHCRQDLQRQDLQKQDTDLSTNVYVITCNNAIAC